MAAYMAPGLSKVIVYEGNNEAWNYLDDTGFFRTERYKHLRERQPPSADENSAGSERNI